MRGHENAGGDDFQCRECCVAISSAMTRFHRSIGPPFGATEPENVIRSFVTLLDPVRDYDFATHIYGSIE
jgi:hypothetical protein